MKTIGIIGGSQKRTFSEIANKEGYNIIFHNGKEKKGFKSIINKADCVVIMLGACGHVTMNSVKSLCKKNNTHVIYMNGFGATGAIQKGVNWIERQAA